METLAELSRRFRNYHAALRIGNGRIELIVHQDIPRNLALQNRPLVITRPHRGRQSHHAGKQDNDATSNKLLSQALRF